MLAFLLCKCLTLLVNIVSSAPSDVRGHNYIPDDIIAIATRANGYDYDDMDASKIHYMQQLDDRRNWRKKTLSKPIDDRDWERRRYEYDNQRYINYPDSKSFNGIERQREMDMPPPGYRHRNYDDFKSSEIAHAGSLV